jgi:hypothetical protein
MLGTAGFAFDFTDDAVHFGQDNMGQQKLTLRTIGINIFPD